MLVFMSIWVKMEQFAQRSEVSGIHAQGHILQVMRSQCSGHLEPHLEKHCVAFAFSLSGCFQLQCFSYFLSSLPLSLPFFFVFLFSLLSQCDGSLDVPMWLGCGDFQPRESFTVQGLADHNGGPCTSRAPTFHSARCSCQIYIHIIDKHEVKMVRY